MPSNLVAFSTHAYKTTNLDQSYLSIYFHNCQILNQSPKNTLQQAIHQLISTRSA